MEETQNNDSEIIHNTAEIKNSLRVFSSYPPGWRFNPEDSEVITCYLQPKIKHLSPPMNLIHDVNIYRHNPNYLAARYEPATTKSSCVLEPPEYHFGKMWYFFTPRDKKYANGSRPDRKAGDGYWKATGADKPIGRDASNAIGFRKALVFYQGNPPKGNKTPWIMHEFRVSGPSRSSQRERNPTDERTKMRLDDFVLCRIYKKEEASKRSSNRATQQSPTDRVEENSEDRDFKEDIAGDDHIVNDPELAPSSSGAHNNDVIISYPNDDFFDFDQFIYTQNVPAVPAPIPLNMVQNIQICPSNNHHPSFGAAINSNYHHANPKYPIPYAMKPHYNSYENDNYNPSPMQNWNYSYHNPSRVKMTNNYYHNFDDNNNELSAVCVHDGAFNMSELPTPAPPSLPDSGAPLCDAPPDDEKWCMLFFCPK